MCSKVVKNEQPLVHICLWSSPIDFYEGVYIGPEMEITDMQLVDKVLFDWAPEEKVWQNKEWAYSLFLTSLNTINDIKQKIVYPVTELMKGNLTQAAGLTELEGVVKYEKVDKNQFDVV